jgi:transcriptional regulator with XRE-family HTH domain
MRVTAAVLSTLEARFRSKTLPKIKQSEVAEKMGYGRAWMTKLMKGSIQNLTDDQVEKLEEALSVRFSAFDEKGGKVPAIAAEAARLMSENPIFGQVLTSIVELASHPHVVRSPRWYETKDMTKVGQQIIGIVLADQDRPGKVAREVLKLLS